MRFKKALLTNSCTAALEMSAVLANIQSGDEVIMPSFTYVSTANAFILRGAKIIFADSKPNSPNIDEGKIESLITSKTKAIVVMHYAGRSCNMDVIVDICKRKNILLIEDAAQCIDSYYNDKPLGSIGDIGCFSFHKTKNIHCYEGGFITINNPDLIKRAEIILEKGTNRAEFDRREVAKYEWVDVGFSATPSALSAAFLYSQLVDIDKVQQKRKLLWNLYVKLLKPSAANSFFQIPEETTYAIHNAHIFYIVCKNASDKNELITYLKSNQVNAVFHYQALHDSKYFQGQYNGVELVNAKVYENCLLRLPMFYSLSEEDVVQVCALIESFYKNKK